MNELTNRVAQNVQDCTVELGLLNVPYEKLSIDQLKSHATALNKQAEKRDKERKEIKKEAIRLVEDAHRDITNNAYETLINTRKEVIEFRRQKVQAELELLHNDFKPILDEVVEDMGVSDFNIIPKFTEKDLSMNKSMMYEYAHKLVDTFIENQIEEEYKVLEEDVEVVVSIPHQEVKLMKSDLPSFVRVLKRNKIEYELRSN